MSVWSVNLFGSISALGCALSPHLPQEVSPDRDVPKSGEAVQLSVAQLQQIAESITVKIQSGYNSGSGAIVRRQGRVYTLVTNEHVLIFGNGSTYPVQTPDGMTYEAHKLDRLNVGGNDLALLQFESDRNYTVATLGDSTTLELDDEVFAAGFPVEADETLDRGFSFTVGTVNLMSDRAFGGGYQIGYTNAIEKGMSGGPVLDRSGRAIALNGMHAYPIWGNPYVFEDGSIASDAQFQQMSPLSWAIPINTVIKFIPELTSN